jgi:hypothetical protein
VAQSALFLAAWSLAKPQEYRKQQFYPLLDCELANYANALYNSRLTLYQQTHRISQLTEGLHQLPGLIGCQFKFQNVR